MAGKVKVQPVSRAGIEPLVAMAEQLRASLPGWDGSAPTAARGQAASDLALDLAHLARHDGDGFLVASVGDEVVGFAASYVRSRQLTISQPWLLPEYQDHEVADALLRRTMTYGDRSGASDVAAHLLSEAHWQAAFFRFGLRPRFPVYRLELAPDAARVAGLELAKLLPGSELTRDALNRRAGAADLERLDRLARGVARPMDHEYWLGGRRLRLAKVREGQRISAYAYGGPGQCGPVAGATTEATLAGLGWALQLAAEGASETVRILIPAVFESALETLFDAGAACPAVSTWMTRNAGIALERYVVPSVTIA